ncbi:nitric oxide synthase [Eubacteriales bacterium OttesenSCG-928-N13]|nr:nitric oxide synthase [Eubacteriales bacterium OttesenSCG-928-N13]
MSVIYHSMTGNTKKVAEVIASELHVTAQPVNGARAPAALDLLVLGDGAYAGNINKGMTTFIQSLTPDMVKRAALFSTYGGQNEALPLMRQLLEQQGIEVVKETFSCAGKAFFFMHRGHPNASDLDAARQFARRLLSVQ